MTDTLQPDVSFIIAAYNAEDTLARAIQSALDQDGVTVEAIVIDDCSSDGTRSVAESFGDKRVRLISLARNGGPSAARNAGLDAAVGRWVATLDSDDEMQPLRLKRMIDLAENLNAQVAVDNLEVVSLSDARRITMFSHDLLAKQPLLMLAEFIDSNVLFKATHNFGYMKPVFRRDFLEQHALRFDETIKVGEDYLFLASALAHGGKCVVDPHAGYIYHIREGSISRVLKLRHVDEMIAADQTFLRQHTLDRKARAAQRRRARSLVDARSFLLLIDGIKQRSVPGILGAAWRNPRALRHLKLPIGARLRRLSKRFLRSSKFVAAAAVPKISNLGAGPHSSKG